MDIAKQTMITIVLPGNAVCGGNIVEKFLKNILLALHGGQARVSLFLYGTDTIFLCHPERQVHIEVAKVQNGKLKLQCKLSDLGTMVGRPIVEDQIERIQKVFRGAMNGSGKHEDGKTYAGAEALRLAAYMTRMTPDPDANVVFFVGSRGEHTRDLVDVAGLTIAKEPNLTCSIIEVLSDQPSAEWRDAAAQFGGGSLYHVPESERLGEAFAQAIRDWCLSPLQVCREDDDDDGILAETRRRCGGGNLQKGGAGSPLMVSFDATLLERSDKMVEAEELANNRARVCKLRSGSVFWGVPFRRVSASGRPVKIWKSGQDEIVGEASLDVIPGSRIQAGIDNKLPIFVDYDQAVNIYECRTIMQRLAAIVEAETWQDKTLPIRVYLPIIQRQLSYYFSGDKDNFCGLSILRKLIFSVLVSTPEQVLISMCRRGYGEGRIGSASTLTEISECWLALGAVCSCFCSTSMYVHVVSQIREQFLRGRGRQLMAERVKSRQKEWEDEIRAGLGDPSERARALENKYRGKGIRKSLRECQAEIAAKDRASVQKAQRNKFSDPVQRDADELQEKRDKAEITDQMKQLVMQGFLGCDLKIPIEQIRAQERWRLPFAGNSQTRSRKFGSMPGQMCRLPASVTEERGRLCLRNVARNFDMMMFVPTLE